MLTPFFCKANYEGDIPTLTPCLVYDNYKDTFHAE